MELITCPVDVDLFWITNEDRDMYAYGVFLEYNVIVYNKIFLVALFWVQKKTSLQF